MVPHHRGTLLRLPRHSSAPDPADLAGVRRWVRGVRGRTAVDLFCGAGGLSLCLRDAGFTVLVGADSDELAMETHTANLGGLGYVGDLTDPTEFLEHLDAWGIQSVDLVAGGVPCQPFSRAGQSRIRDLVRSGRPSDPAGAATTTPAPDCGGASCRSLRNSNHGPCVLVENVPDLPSWDEGAVLIGFFESLRALGYHADARILDAYSHGVPQHRARLMLIGLRDFDNFEWPAAHATIPTLRDAIGDLPPVPSGQRLDIPYRPRPGGGDPRFVARMRAGVEESERGVIHDHVTRAVRPDDMEAFRLLAEGQTYDDLPEHLQRYAGTSSPTSTSDWSGRTSAAA
jgi:DNA (cytosine-5)-methyltransferase 1